MNHKFLTHNLPPAKNTWWEKLIDNTYKFPEKKEEPKQKEINNCKKCKGTGVLNFEFYSRKCECQLE